jgi:tyrosine-protein kinase Tec
LAKIIFKIKNRFQVKGEEYTVIDDSQDHWWQVVNKLGEKGFIPSNYVKEKDALGLQNFEW